MKGKWLDHEFIILIPRGQFLRFVWAQRTPKIPRDGTVTKDERRKEKKSEKAQLGLVAVERESGEEGD